VVRRNDWLVFGVCSGSCCRSHRYWRTCFGYGACSFFGEPQKNTLNMLAEEVNAQGGILGRPLRLVIYDDESDVNKCVMAARKLLDRDQAVAVIGPSISGNTLAVIQFFVAAQVPLISCAAAEKIVHPVNPWIFNTPQLDRHAVSTILAHAKSKGLRKMAILTVSDGYGQAGRQVLQAALPAQGFSLVADEVYGPKDTDMTAQLTKIAQSGAEALICWGTNPGPAVVARNRQQLGLTFPVYMSHGVASDKFIELAGGAAEGILLPAGRLVVLDHVPQDHPQRLLLGAYTAAYSQRFQAPVSSFGGYAHDAFRLLVAAITKAGSTQPAAIRSALESLGSFPGVSGIYRITPENHNGLDESAFMMVTIRNGTWAIAP
jgi:branched-chain amino acid transport system substrate-binding protein